MQRKRGAPGVSEVSQGTAVFIRQLVPHVKLRDARPLPQRPTGPTGLTGPTGPTGRLRAIGQRPALRGGP